MKIPLQRIFVLSFIAFLVIGCPERRGNTSAKPDPQGGTPQGKPSAPSKGKPGPGSKNAPPAVGGANKQAPMEKSDLINVAKKDGGPFQALLAKVVEVAPPTLMDPMATKAPSKQKMSKGTTDKEALKAIFNALDPKQTLKTNPKPCTPSHIIVLRGAKEGKEKELGVVTICSIDKKNEDLPAKYMDHAAKLEYRLAIPDGKALIDVLEKYLPKSKL